LFETRFRKLLTKNIGLTYYRLETSDSRNSVLYYNVEDMETLDKMADGYSTWDADDRNDDYDEHHAGDSCLSIRHYFSPYKKRVDPVDLTDSCSETHGETDLEVVNVYWRGGL